MREMIVASRIERTLSKAEILEIYLNSIYLGRSSWGIEMAARSYFGKAAKDADRRGGRAARGLAKGPNYYNPDTSSRARAQERMAYVLSRMQEDGVLTAEQVQQALGRCRSASPSNTHRDYRILLCRSSAAARRGRLPASTASRPLPMSCTRPLIRPCSRPPRQRSAGGARTLRAERRPPAIQGAEANLGDGRQGASRLQARCGCGCNPAWRQALEAARLPLYDVQWSPAVVVAKGRNERTAANVLKVGLRRRPVLPLSCRMRRRARSQAP